MTFSGGEASDRVTLSAATIDPGAPVGMARIEPGQLDELSHELASTNGARLADLFATPAPDGRLALRAVYALDSERRYLIAECELEGDRLPPVAELEPAAFVEQCELYEHYGVRPRKGARLNRVLVPPHRADAFPTLHQRERIRMARDYEPHVITGEAFEFPFGPVRAAGAESLYMGLVTTGEEVLDLYLFHWHKHRGVERRLLGLEPERASFLVERLDGLSTVGNALAFCRAIETIAGVSVPDAAAHSRSLALELERIYNHTAALAALCQSTGLSVGQARVEIVLEQLLRLNAAAFGHRYLFGVVRPGGVTRAPDVEVIAGTLPGVLGELRYVVRSLLRTNSYMDRLEATGIVTPEEAARLSLVGPVARSSGQDIDARRDHPVGPADALLETVPIRAGGDALARMRTMVDEIDQSEALVRAQLDAAGPGVEPVQRGAGNALGWAESVRGESLAWVALDEAGRIAHVRLRTAPVRNWRAFDDAARSQNVFTDIPIIEASFWLTVAGFSR